MRKRIRIALPAHEASHLRCAASTMIRGFAPTAARWLDTALATRWALELASGDGDLVVTARRAEELLWVCDAIVAATKRGGARTADPAIVDGFAGLRRHVALACASVGREAA